MMSALVGTVVSILFAVFSVVLYVGSAKFFKFELKYDMVLLFAALSWFTVSDVVSLYVEEEQVQFEKTKSIILLIYGLSLLAYMTYKYVDKRDSLDYGLFAEGFGSVLGSAFFIYKAFDKNSSKFTWVGAARGPRTPTL